MPTRPPPRPVPAPAVGALGDLPVTAAVTIAARELTWRFSHSSGPGGQGVNTSDSRVELSWHVPSSAALTDEQRARALAVLAPRLVDGVLTVTSSQFRAQLRNREEARVKLAALVAGALAPPPPARRATRPTKGSQRRRLDDKKRRGEVKRLRRSTD